MRKLYHREILWKENFDRDALKLVWSAKRLSKHIMEDYIHNDNIDEKHKYTLKGLSKVFNEIKFENKGYLFEVEEEDGRVIKAVYRISYDEEKDICLVFRYGKIATAWVNFKNDKHFTLDKSKYVC